MIRTQIQLTTRDTPLCGVDVQIGDQIGTTDEEGIVDVTLREGEYTLRTTIGGAEVQRRVTITDQPLVTVNLGVASSAPVSQQVEMVIGDRYRVKRLLGRGGMGVVYQADDELLNRPVAIKMLSGQLEGNSDAQRVFLEEARALAPLTHPNLVGIYDILSIDGRTSMVLEYIVGENLEELLKAGPLDEMSALRWMVQLTRAIVYMHGRGFIHRDIKPANAVAQDDGKIKIIDFGLARSLHRIAARGTAVRGTPAYMAPEQITGADTTPKTDVYQLGITFWELLTADLPFRGDMMYAHVHTEAPMLCDVREGSSKRVEQVIRQCMEKDPADRPTAKALLQVLQELYLSGENLSADSEALYERIRTSSVVGSIGAAPLPRRRESKKADQASDSGEIVDALDAQDSDAYADDAEDVAGVEALEDGDAIVNDDADDADDVDGSGDEALDVDDNDANASDDVDDVGGRGVGRQPAEYEDGNKGPPIGLIVVVLSLLVVAGFFFAAPDDPKPEPQRPAAADQLPAPEDAQKTVAEPAQTQDEPPAEAESAMNVAEPTPAEPAEAVPPKVEPKNVVEKPRKRRRTSPPKPAEKKESAEQQVSEPVKKPMSDEEILLGDESEDGVILKSGNADDVML